MCLCTLLTPVSSDVIGMSPRYDVVLFSTATHLISCRKSGQQVWSSRIPFSNTQVATFEWSSDGEAVAVIFKDGSMASYDISTGRVFSKLGSDANVSSVAWSKQPEMAPHNTLTKIIDLWPEEENTEQRLAAVGKSTGKLSIRVYGALVIDDIEIGAGPIYKALVDESAGEYAVIDGQVLSVMRIDATNTEAVNELVSFREMTSHVQLIAQTIKSLDIVWENLIKIDESLNSMVKTNSNFSKHSQDETNDVANVKTELFSLALTGHVSERVDNWIKEEHEQGFKRWYKTMSQSWDSLRHTVSERSSEQTTKLISLFSEISLDCRDSQESLKLLYELMSIIELQQPIFEKEATFIEYVFTEEISRPIAVTKLGKVDVAHVIENLSAKDLLGHINPIYASKLKDCSSDARKFLDVKVDHIRHQSRKELNQKYQTQINGHVNHIIHNSDHSYSLIVNDKEFVQSNAQHNISTTETLATTANIILPTTAGSVVVGVDQIKCHVVVGKSIVPLDFEPIAVVGRCEDTKVIACVLSEDCQHYQFIETDICSKPSR